MDIATQTIKIGVSSCLIGNKVRYDGNSKFDKIISNICRTFQCVPVCPEAEIGLGVPRPPLRIIKIDKDFHARGKTNPEFDVTKALEDHASITVKGNEDLCGYIFKARSPSCGISSTPWHDQSLYETGIGSGIFSAKIRSLLPALPVIEEILLADNTKVEIFLKEVIQYAERRDVR